MAVKAKKTKLIADEMAKFSKGEIEFLFDTIKNAMIPGKFLPVAMDVVTKLRTQYKLLEKEDLVIKDTDLKSALKETIDKVQKETFAKVKRVQGELYIEDEK